MVLAGVTMPLICLIIILDLHLSDHSRPDRLRDIADRFNVDHDAVLDNVLYARAYTSVNMQQFIGTRWFY